MFSVFWLGDACLLVLYFNEINSVMDCLCIEIEFVVGCVIFSVSVLKLTVISGQWIFVAFGGLIVKDFRLGVF